MVICVLCVSLIIVSLFLHVSLPRDILDINDSGVLASLNLAGNSIGDPVPPAGWKYHPENIPEARFMQPNGDGRQANRPEGTTYPGIEAIYNVIQDMGSLASLDISDNRIGNDRAEIKQICDGKSVECTL
jgi:hypothetical protein